MFRQFSSFSDLGCFYMRPCYKLYNILYNKIQLNQEKHNKMFMTSVADLQTYL